MDKKIEGELLKAYLAWVRIPSDRFKERVSAWEDYIAIRDGKENKNDNPKSKLSAVEIECLSPGGMRRYTH